VTPTRLGPYPIEREVGCGGMGVVYLARDTRLDRAIAIKVLPDALAADPERLARFEREARLLASLSHPNIAGPTTNRSSSARHDVVRVTSI
jgi:eukaryotic-like serine/threonine-protein kinase